MCVSSPVDFGGLEWMQLSYDLLKVGALFYGLSGECMKASEVFEALRTQKSAKTYPPCVR